MKNEENSASIGTNRDIPWDNFIKFVRQLSHDLRNQLNAAELQAALIGELTSDEELKLEARRISHVIIGARDLRLARLQRLAQSFEDARLEFRQFIEEQDTVMVQ